jgi:hypothetical protein
MRDRFMRPFVRRRATLFLHEPTHSAVYGSPTGGDDARAVLGFACADDGSTYGACPVWASSEVPSGPRWSRLGTVLCLRLACVCAMGRSAGAVLQEEIQLDSKHRSTCFIVVVVCSFFCFSSHWNIEEEIIIRESSSGLTMRTEHAAEAIRY